MADNNSIISTKKQLTNKIKTSEKANTLQKQSNGITLKLLLTKQEKPVDNGDKIVIIMMIMIMMMIKIKPM